MSGPVLFADADARTQPYSTPGVYLERIEGRGLPGFRAGVPAIVGFVARSEAMGDVSGPGRPRLITRWEQFGETFGAGIPGGFLDYAVRGFFSNGGECCVVVPVLAEPPNGRGLIAPFGERGILEEVEGIDLVCVPDIVSSVLGASDRDILKLQREVLTHCERMGNRLALLDAFSAPSAETVPEAERVAALGETEVFHWRALISNAGALYMPWVRVEPLPRGQAGADAASAERGDEAPSGVKILAEEPRSALVAVPPSGHVAGVISRRDRVTGVQGAPANEVVEGVLDLEAALSNDNQARLNEVGVNCLRSFPGRGIRVWGAKTLSGSPRWRYVPVRRLFITLVRWAEQSLANLAFEPNDAFLWERIRSRVEAFCFDLLRQGALSGNEPEDAYFVKCDGELNTPDVREAGEVIVEVGLAPLVPAEFIVIRLVQRGAGVEAEFS
jgi:hypothetical protein